MTIRAFIGSTRRAFIGVAMVVVVLAAGVLAVGYAASAAAQPPPPPSAPSPAAAVSPPPEPIVPARPPTSPPSSPRPSWNPAPGLPTPLPTAPATPGPDAPNPGMPEPAYPGGADPNSPTPYPTPSSLAPTPTDPADPNQAPGSSETPDGGGSGCGITNISGCVEKAIDSFLQHAVSTSLNPLLTLLGQTLLTTPDPDTLPQIGVLWSHSWQLMAAIYTLVVMASGVLLMLYQSVQTRWSARELAPRLVIGFLAGAMSMLIATTAIRCANALAAAVAGAGVDPRSAAAAIRQLVEINTPQSDTFLICLELALVVMLAILLISYAVRLAITVVLIVGAPLALMTHALPGVDSVARWWWRSIAACLAIQVAQSLVLVTVLRVLLTPGGWAWISPNATGEVDIMVALALMGVLAKTPFWLLSTLKIGHGRTLVGSLARSYIMMQTLGALRGIGTAAKPAKPVRLKIPKVKDPYAKVQATASGQLMLPLKGLKKVPPKPAPVPRIPHAATIPLAPPRGEQLMLPLLFPSRVDLGPTPRLGRDGQYRLPIPVERIKRAPTPNPPVPKPAPGTRHAKQLALDFTPAAEPDPYARQRPLRSGQYRLPIEVRRVPPSPVSSPPRTPPRTSTPPPVPATPRSSGRQLHLPLPDLPVKRRTHRREGL